MANRERDAILRWYAAHQRRPAVAPPDADPLGPSWSVRSCLQQTPSPGAAGVRGVAHRWPRPASTGRGAAADAVRAWGRLGYPRRALRLHADGADPDAASTAASPSSVDADALPGIGSYTAAAVASFASASGGGTGYHGAGSRAPVQRPGAATGQPIPPPRATAKPPHCFRPSRPGAPLVGGGMELGALGVQRPPGRTAPVARGPVLRLAAGREPGGHRGPPGGPVLRWYGPAGRAAACILRDATGPVSAPRLDAAWPDPRQRARALGQPGCGRVVDPKVRWDVRAPRRERMSGGIGSKDLRPGRQDRAWPG